MPNATLHIIEGPAQGQTVSLAAPETLFGRDVPGQTWLQGYNQMSRRHARLFWSGEALLVEDLGSTNGVYVNGQRVASARLQNGDLLKMGDLVARVSLSGVAHGGTPPGATVLEPAPPSYPPASYPQTPYPHPQAPPAAPPPSYPPPYYPPPSYPPGPSYPTAPIEIKSPGLAAFLSALIIGAGQIYNGEVGKGIVMFCLAVVSSFFWVVGIGILMTIGMWIWTIVDAYESAQRINRTHNRGPY